MNQSQTVDLQVKVCLDDVTKRVPTCQTFADLTTQCRQICDKAEVPSTQKMRVFYTDSDGDKLDVTDDYELQMAYATALSADCKVKFFIELPGYAKPAPVVIAPEPIEIKPEVPVIVAAVNNQ